MPSNTPEESFPPPGRCGVAGPGGGLFCELRAGHAGMHEARQYPPDVFSIGVPAYWSQDPAATGVLLTPEEAARTLLWWAVYREEGFPGITDAALVARLEAARG